MIEPDRCHSAGSIDIIAGRCQHCGSDADTHNYGEEK